MRSAALVAAFVVVGSARATQTDNRGLHAVPARAAVAIDGHLDEWDLSAQALMCYDIENLRDTYSVEVAMMYDAASLYVAIHWKDPRPLSNHHDPRYQGDKGWAADSVQLRFRTDRIAHVTAWYFADRDEPAIHIDYGDDTDPFGGPARLLLRTGGCEMEAGAAMAFREDPDGAGYTQEIRLPWQLLASSHPYGAGDALQCGVELLWGGGDWPEMRYADNLMPGRSSREFFWTAVSSWGPVTLEPEGNLRLPVPEWLARAGRAVESPPGPVPIAYSLPRDSRVTIAIDDSQGVRVRNLIAALPRPRGPNRDTWDGLDDNGRPVPPGEYTYKAIYHDPIHVSWALSFASPGNPSWPTPDGRGQFYGDHSAPRAVAAGGDYVALACPIGEAGQPLIGCDLDGQRLWGQANRVFGKYGIQSLATDGKTLWVGCEADPPVIYRVEVATGLYAPWQRTATDADGREFRVLDLPVTASAGESDRVADAGGGSGDAAAGPNLSAIAYAGGVLAVCLARDDQVLLLDAETGDVRETRSVREPIGAAIDADGSVVVLTMGRLVRLGRDGAVVPLAADTYPEARSVATDAHGRIYLSVRGTEQNVKVLSPDGVPLREIGKRGGRPLDGPYDPAAMRDPAQIAIDRRGRLWVTEETTNPKRTGVWDTTTGALLEELVGTTSYAGAGGIDPDDPTMAFSDDTVYRLDWATGASRPVYSVGSGGGPDDLFPPSVFHITQRVIWHGRDTLVYTAPAAWGVTQCAIHRGGEWRAAAAVGTALDPEELRRNQYAPTEVRERFSHPVFAGHTGEAFAWADSNGDGIVQPHEMRFAPVEVDGKRTRLLSNYWGQLPGPDGAIPYFSLEPQAILKLPVTTYTACGAPVYDPARLVVVRPERPILCAGEGMLLGGSDGVVYANQDPLTAVDARGRVLFTYPSHHVSVHGSHTARAARSGYLIGPSSFLGAVDLGKGIGEVFSLNGNLGENYLFTGDGLWVQALLRDTRGGFTVPGKAEPGVSFDDATAGSESFGGNFIRTSDGRVYLTIGTTDARVLEVTGLDTIRRFAGRLTYSGEQYAEAQMLLIERTARAAEPRAWTIARTSGTPTVDGRPDEWPDLMDDSRDAIEVQESPEQRFARVEARYDAGCLYLAYRVFAAADHMRNAGQDERLLFKTGDAVDLMLGPEPQKGLTGDLRLLMIVRPGGPIAVLNQKVAPGAPPAERYVFTSWRTIAFDRVAVVPDVRLATGPAPGGYFVEASVPWATLGVEPVSGLELRGDFGVLYADSGGTATVARQYWSNKATGLVSDVPGEADLVPELWGVLTLE